MKKYFLIAGLLILPQISLAADPALSGSGGSTIWSLWGYGFHLIDRLTQIFWVLSVVTFLWGLVQFLQKADAPAEQAKAKQLMIGAIVAFTIAVSFWGLVNVAIGALSLTPDSTSAGLQPIRSK